jgi:hypothetical protein
MRAVKILKIVLIVLLIAAVLSFIVMSLWNWLMPAIFGLRTITFWQALGLLLLSKILLGGFHRHGHSGRRGWRRRMEARWAKMTPEERERFRAGMSNWRPCGFRPEEPGTAEQSSR